MGRDGKRGKQAAKDARGLVLLRGESEAGSDETRRLIAPEIRKYVSLARTMRRGFIRDEDAVGSAPWGTRSLAVSQGAITGICMEYTGASSRMAPPYTHALRTCQRAVTHPSANYARTARVVRRTDAAEAML